MTENSKCNQVLRVCDNCRKLGAKLKSQHYGTVFNWCSFNCFDEYISKGKARSQ